MSNMEQQKSNQESLQKEYVVRISGEKQRRFSIMRFNHSHKVDVTKWKQVKMERENNLKEYKLDDDNPKFGAGSEFGRDLKEEARRRKLGIITKQYNPDDQPWLMRVNGKGGRKFKGIREGGITENASYYVFTQASEGIFEAHPVEEWYNFTPIHCFKALSAEEAEEEFGRRDKVLNYFSIMVKKKLQIDAEEDEDEDKKPGIKGRKKKTKSAKDFKLTDMDEWIHDNDDSGDSMNDIDDTEETSSKKQPKKSGRKKKAKKSDDEAMEESDEGDFDDKEVDYITSSSGSEEEIGEDEKANRDLKGVEDEEAIRKLMSDDEEEDAAAGEEADKENEDVPDAKEKEQKAKQKQKKSDSSGESSSESSDSDFDDPKFTSAIFVSKSKKKSGSSDNSASSSRANTPTKDSQKGMKRKFTEPSTLTAAVKKPKIENGSTSSSANATTTLDGINEETVRRYLSRKPMTASELLHKFKSKKTKMSSEQLVNKITDVLKKIPLQKTNIKGKMYLSLIVSKET